MLGGYGALVGFATGCVEGLAGFMTWAFDVLGILEIEGTGNRPGWMTELACRGFGAGQ